MPHPIPPQQVPPQQVPPRPANDPVPAGPLLVDCDSCRMRHTDACRDCVVGVLLADGPVVLDGDEQQALGALADAGLVPRLRLVPGRSPEDR